MTLASSIKAAPCASKLTFFYCLPAILAIGLVIGDYYQRTADVAKNYLSPQRERVETAFQDVSNEHNKKDHADNGHEEIATALRNHKLIKQPLDNPNTSEQHRQLINYYVRNRLEHIDKDPVICRQNKDEKLPAGTYEICEKDRTLTIWMQNSVIVATLALLPFLLLGTHLGFSTTLPASTEERLAVVNKSWWMKFLIAFILAYGWIYLLNPAGRGAGTIEQFLIGVDLSQGDTLPIYLKEMTIKPIIAGFLGWYLYLLTYYFSKLFTHDVLSTNSYGLMFQKFLFTYGIAIVLPSIQSSAVGGDTGTATSFVVFLAGYFPMSAFSLLKDSGLKILHGTQSEKGQLQELPGISRWQILRLEEEGIDSMGALAAHCRLNELRRDIPALSKLIDYWVDIARLYTVLGHENYQKVKKHCRTASEFVLSAKDSQFAEALATESITNAQETARIISRTFPEQLSYTTQG